MPTQVTMPKLGLNMTEGRLTQWLITDGSPVRPGQPIFEVETDKVTTEVEAATGGVLRHVAPAGAEVPVTGLLGYILQLGEDMPGTPAPAGPAEGVPGRATPAADLVRPAAAGAAEVRASPLIRRMAREAGLDLSAVVGSGPAGRITQEDVERAIAAARQAAAPPPASPLQAEPEPGPRAVAAETGVTPLAGVRAVIARRMLASSQQTAPVTLTTEADATELVNMRKQVNEAVIPRLGFGISYNDILVRVVARALGEFPYMNARQEGNGVRLLAQAHIGVAVDTERGLLVPVVRNAGDLSLTGIARELRGLIERAAAGRSTPDDLDGGTFTITNLGMFDVDSFTPIINWPEVAILGVGRIVQKPAVHRGEVRPREQVALSLTFDHRVVDGAPAARFLQRIKKLIERPYELMVEGDG